MAACSGDNGGTWRGGDWLLMRWLGDQEGTPFYHRLEETRLTGTANIAAAAGEPFPGLFGDFSLTLYADSLPGIPKTSVPPRERLAGAATVQLQFTGPAGAALPATLHPQVAVFRLPGP